MHISKTLLLALFTFCSVKPADNAPASDSNLTTGDQEKAYFDGLKSCADSLRLALGDKQTITAEEYPSYAWSGDKCLRQIEQDLGIDIYALTDSSDRTATFVDGFQDCVEHLFVPAVNNDSDFEVPNDEAIAHWLDCVKQQPALREIVAEACAARKTE